MEDLGACRIGYCGMRPTVHVPIALLAIRLQIRREEDVRALHLCELLGHHFGAACEVDGVMDHGLRIVFLLAAGQSMDGRPSRGIFTERMHNLATQDA